MCCQSILDNGNSVLIVAINISPKKSIINLIEFIKENLMKYTPDVSGKLAMILSGDFNVTFALAAALSVIDAVFARHINQIKIKTFIPYFSCHKPLLAFIECGNMEIE